MSLDVFAKLRVGSLPDSGAVFAKVASALAGGLAVKICVEPRLGYEIADPPLKYLKARRMAGLQLYVSFVPQT
jgi:hypothetical protein